MSASRATTEWDSNKLTCAPSRGLLVPLRHRDRVDSKELHAEVLRELFDLDDDLT